MTWTTGQADGAGILVLHDRHGDGAGSVDPLAQDLASSHRMIAVRSARTQSERSKVRGYFWHLGPYEQPEISTLGDALYHLEGLLLEVYRETGSKVTLFGRGEGGGVALLLGLLWRDVVAGVVSVDGPLATNIGELPIELADAAGLPVLLVADTRGLDDSGSALVGRGAVVTRVSGGDAAAVAEWVRALG